MAKKKVSKSMKKAAIKKTASKSAPSKKASAAKTNTRKTLKSVKKQASVVSGVTKAAPAQRRQTATVSTKVAPVANSSAAKAEITLGRPLVTQEERLYMLFHDDYQARQVFEFLKVENVKELEAFSQQQIVHLMSKPLRMTVDRIRQRLAQYKRSLKDDEQFAADYLKHAD